VAGGSVATGTGADGGSRGARPPSRGQATTSSASATSTASRATLPQRILRHTPSEPIAAARRPATGVRPCYLPPPPSIAGTFTMAAPEPLYVESAISSSGTIVSDHDWGTRALAYEIRHRTDAEYHLLQFHGPATLLASLQRNLRIADGVLRFRIVKLAPGTPAPTELPRAEAPAAAPATSAPAAPAAPAEPAETPSAA
jgi:small subunit ribosomal protein S6